MCACRISFGAAQADAADRAEDVNSVSIWTVTSLSLDDHRYSCEPCASLSEVFPSPPPVGPVTDLLYSDKRSVTTNGLNVISAELDVKIMLYGIWMSGRGTISKYTFVAEKQWKSAGRKYISYDWNIPIVCRVMNASLITLFCFECIFFRAFLLLFATNL